MQIIPIDFGRGRGQRYCNNQPNPKRFSCFCCCYCMSNRRLGSYTVMSFAIPGFLGITICKQTKMQSAILPPMLSKHGIVNFQTNAFSGCVYSISIPRGGNVWLFPTISLQWFFLKGCSQYSFDTFESVQRVRFKYKARNSGNIKLINSRSTITVVFLNLNIVISEGTDRYEIR